MVQSGRTVRPTDATRRLVSRTVSSHVTRTRVARVLYVLCYRTRLLRRVLGTHVLNRARARGRRTRRRRHPSSSSVIRRRQSSVVGWWTWLKP